MFYIYHQDFPECKEVKILGKAVDIEDAIIKMYVIAREKSKENKTEIVENENFVDEFNVIEKTIIDAGYIWNEKKIVNEKIKIGKYAILQVPKDLLKKSKNPVYSKGEILEYLKRNMTNIGIVSEDKIEKIANSIDKLNSEDLVELSNYCSVDHPNANNGFKYFILGLIKHKQGDDDKKFDFHLKSADLNYPIGMRFVGNYYTARGKYDSAIHWYSRAVEMKDFPSMKSLSNVYIKMGPSKHNKELSKYWNNKYEEEINYEPNVISENY
jgi:tetratricopeptide (TPR) repeat protein